MSQPNPREVITTQALSIWVAAMAVYLAGDESRFTTGQAFSVDGGWTV